MRSPSSPIPAAGRHWGVRVRDYRDTDRRCARGTCAKGRGTRFYAGRTEAVDGKGNFFSGDIEIQVRFVAEQSQRGDHEP